MKSISDPISNPAARFLTAACLALSLTLVASAPASAETLRFRLRGQEAVAGFSSTDPTGCIVSHVFVAAMDAGVKTGPGQTEPHSRTMAIVSQYDTCTNHVLLDGFGETLLPPDAFVISDLESATLNATIEVVDQANGSSFPLSVNLTWAADGDTSRVKDHFHMKSPVFTVNAKFSAVSREATASGTISDGATNFTPAPADFALLNAIKSGVLEVTR
jgi:hypothetical protein